LARLRPSLLLSLSVLSVGISGAQPADVPARGDHPPEQRYTFAGFVIDTVTQFYDAQGYIILEPHPLVDFRGPRLVKLGYTGKRQPFHAVSVEILR
jgi:hypothetical protein